MEVLLSALVVVTVGGIAFVYGYATNRRYMMIGGVIFILGTFIVVIVLGQGGVLPEDVPWPPTVR